jgi:hypothetical protein
MSDQDREKPFDTAQGTSDAVDAYLERLDHLLATRAPAAAAAPSLVADAFAAVLALEEGEPGAQPVRLVTGDAEPRMTEALVEELTRRIIERLAPDAVRAVVAEVVSDVAERLVREEIERIRKTHV